jgi:indole-3-glycerol phosphate synthase
LLPDEVALVALSGVSTRAEVEALGRAGAAAVLVGESLVTAPDPEAKLRALTGRS